MKVAQEIDPFIYKPYSHTQIDAVSKEFYVATMESLEASGIPFLVGGAYAFAHYSGIDRHTKDFDIFVKKEDAERVLNNLGQELKCTVDRTFPHWLYKAILGENFIDIIFSSGNGVAIVDDEWFNKAGKGLVLGVPALLIPAEEMIWSKGFIMERERFDGADIAHILRGWGTKMDWNRLLARYGTHWRVLFSHLVLFGYIYPSELQAIPDWVMETMTKHLIANQKASPTHDNLCQGTLLSRQQYLKDVAEWHYDDARTRTGGGVPPIMNAEEVAHWTAAAFGHGTGKA